jgi:hypothetical protein
MSVIASGNEINYMGGRVPQGNQLGPWTYYAVGGYVDIDETGGTGPFNINVEHPSQSDARTDLTSIVVPVGAVVAGTGIVVPTKNTNGEEAHIVGTNSATVRVGNAVDQTGVTILVVASTKVPSGKTFTPIDVALADALGAASTYRFYTSASIASSKGTMRLGALVMYALPFTMPSLEMFTQKKAPVYSY